jgi:hypothetical protein
MILEPKHKNFKDEYKIKVRVKKKNNIRRHILVAFELHYFQELLNWWHSPFKRPCHLLSTFSGMYVVDVDDVIEQTSKPRFS